MTINGVLQKGRNPQFVNFSGDKKTVKKKLFDNHA